MRRVILAVAGTITVLVLLLGFKTTSGSTIASTPAAITPTQPANSPASASPSGSSAGSSSGSSGSGSSGSAGSGPPSTASKTVTGDSVDTRWGPVQVKITVVNGKITSAEAVDYPQNNSRDQEINSFAIPQLQQETIAASNASIDMVSGATYTSQGYIGSLQSALDKL